MDQRHVTEAVLASVRGFLGGPSPDGEEWCFDFDEHLESNWGAIYGGALAAGTLAVARSVAPDRSPRSLHIQIVRSLPRGRAFATARVRHAGRTVGTAEVDVYDERRKLAAIALLTMVTPSAVAATHHNPTAAPPFRLTDSPLPLEAPTLTPPVTHALNMFHKRDGELVRVVGENVRLNVDGSDAGIIPCTVPWDDLEVTGPEAACLVADAAIGLPLIQSRIPLDAVGPNADLTLRFSTAPATKVITAAATMLSVQHGTATVGIEVQAGDQQLAHGLATSLLLQPT